MSRRKFGLGGLRLLTLTVRTDGGEDVCKTEVVHSVQREQVEQKLLPFFLKEQECMGFIQMPVRGKMGKEVSQRLGHTE